jgi:RNA polymerase sigma-70 factor (ECF subfamily)
LWRLRIERNFFPNCFRSVATTEVCLSALGYNTEPHYGFTTKHLTRLQRGDLRPDDPSTTNTRFRQKVCMNSEAAAYFSNALADTTETQVPVTELSSGAVHSNSESTARLVVIASPVQESSDEDLLLQVSNGSKEALSILFRRHARSVFNVAKRVLRDDSEAEDLLQELFLFLFQKARLFDAAKGSASSWIIQMTYHRAIDRRRYLDFRQHYNTEEFNEDRLKGTRGQVSIDEVAGRCY